MDVLSKWLGILCYSLADRPGQQSSANSHVFHSRLNGHHAHFNALLHRRGFISSTFDSSHFERTSI